MPCWLYGPLKWSVVPHPLRSAWQSRKETRQRSLPTSARCVRHETSCSRCHATLCAIDLRRLVEGCRRYAVCVEIVLMISTSVRRFSEIHEVSLRGATFVFQLGLVLVSTSFFYPCVTFWRRFHHYAACLAVSRGQAPCVLY